MDVIVYGGPGATTVAEVIRRVERIRDLGLPAAWFPQSAGLDMITALSVAAAAVPGIDLGLNVVPIQGRHPVTLAQQALTLANVNPATAITVGLGVTHAELSEGWFDIPYRGIVDTCGQFLDIFATLLGPARSADIAHRDFSAHLSLDVDGPTAAVVLAAMGPKMLELAGRYTDGTSTWLVGPRGIAEHIVPDLQRAAADAGRAAPKVIAGNHICVSTRPDVRTRVDNMMNGPYLFASYRRSMRWEGVDEPVDIALVGSEDQVLDQVEALRNAGVTHLMASVVGEPEERARTLEFLQKLQSI